MIRIVAIFVALCVVPAIASSQTLKGDPVRGKELYLKNTCYGCHGNSGQNGPGNRLVPMTIPEAAFIAYVRNPPRPNLMPSYSAHVLPDSQMGDIWAYLKTLPDAPKAADIPLLREIMNEK